MYSSCIYKLLMKPEVQAISTKPIRRWKMLSRRPESRESMTTYRIQPSIYSPPSFKSIQQFIKPMLYKQSVHSSDPSNQSSAPIHAINPSSQPNNHVLARSYSSWTPTDPAKHGDSPVCTEVCLWRDSLQAFLLALLRDSCLFRTSELSCNSAAPSGK